MPEDAKAGGVALAVLGVVAVPGVADGPLDPDDGVELGCELGRGVAGDVVMLPDTEVLPGVETPPEGSVPRLPEPFGVVVAPGANVVGPGLAAPAGVPAANVPVEPDAPNGAGLDTTPAGALVPVAAGLAPTG